MPDTLYQIILVPRENYWEWVNAAKTYILRFGANITPDPDSAARYMTPQQVITIAAPTGGYPAQGDILQWFKQQYPRLRLDVVRAETPADFQHALQVRLDAYDRLQQPVEEFRLLWPTEQAVIVQPFAASPELFRRWQLPGNDGLDFRAPLNSSIFACADGKVIRVELYQGDPVAQPYGNRLDIEHRAGYRTTYAYLATPQVKVGDVVRAGQVIATAGASGNSRGEVFHLTLKKLGATALGQTNFPHDIIDPTPFLVWPKQLAFADLNWPPGVCLVGLHGRADGRMQEADFIAAQQARVEAVKLLSMAAPEDVDRLRQINPRMFIMARLFAAFQGRVVSPADFVHWVKDDMGLLYQRGVRYFEVHNEPNITLEGWTTCWANGQEFGVWLLDVMTRLRVLYPEALLGYPGLSPDVVPAPWLRTNDRVFLTESDAAAQAADWIGLHAYWQSEDELVASNGGLNYLEYRRRYPQKLLFITEFSNPASTVDKLIKSQQYIRYYNGLRAVPGLGAAFAFIVSSSSGFEAETWRDESGAFSRLVTGVGAREEIMVGPPPLP